MASMINPQSLPCFLYGKLSFHKYNEFEIISSQKLYTFGHQKCRLKHFTNGCKLLRDRKHLARRKSVEWRGIVARIELSNPDDYEVGRLLGSYGYMNITSYGAPQSGGPAEGTFENTGASFSFKDIEKMRSQKVGEGNVQIRLYSGRVCRGPRMGTRVIFKAYPGQLTGGVEADVMAANELAAHAFLQDVPEKETCPNLQILLGGFQTSTGEQWLVFQDDGQWTAANYAKIASEAMAEGRAVGEWEFWDRFNRDLPIKRRQIFIIKLLRGAFNGLAYIHAHGRLHQSLGPASVVLNTIEERDAHYLLPRLRDLAFSVDIRLGFPSTKDSSFFQSDGAIFGGKEADLSSIRGSSAVNSRDLSLDTASEALSEGLWRRAISSGAFTPLEKKAFGIADDIYAAGLLLAYVAFIPLCEVGSIDGPSLQRLLESTFQLDMQAVREYCKADDRWTGGVNFLDLGNGAGWELLQAMLNPNYRLRPIAKSVLNHRFMTGAVL